jgi:tRNA pseudouridine13 synthase
MHPIWPYLTCDIPAIGASARRRLEDFRVDELPAYAPCGSGDHAYVQIEKAGLTTRQAVLALAQALGLETSRIGFAGQKDARGITRQTLSIERVEPSRLQSLDLPRIRILGAARHGSKLRLGSLRGNHFTIRLRELSTARTGDVEDVLRVLARRGVPNYFGPQRFGMRGDTWAVGRALLAGDFTAAVRLVVARPDPGDPASIQRARELAAAGRYREAATAWPRGFADCARLCRRLDATGGDAQRAVFSLERSVLAFYVSAYQAWLFNRVLAERLPTLDCLLPGDVAFSHRTGLCSTVPAPAAEHTRAASFELSPTGPIVGFTMSAPQDEAGAIEHNVLTEAGCVLRDLPRSGPLKCVGGRRPLRFPLENVGLDAGTDHAGAYIELRFALPPGCYATAVLREICKDQLREWPADPTDE